MYMFGKIRDMFFWRRPSTKQVWGRGCRGAARLPAGAWSAMRHPLRHCQLASPPPRPAGLCARIRRLQRLLQPAHVPPHPRGWRVGAVLCAGDAPCLGHCLAGGPFVCTTPACHTHCRTSGTGPYPRHQGPGLMSWSGLGAGVRRPRAAGLGGAPLARATAARCRSRPCSMHACGPAHAPPDPPPRLAPLPPAAWPAPTWL